MLKFRFREKTNTWPGFVDIFSNLVIILIFLLIVFVFLWTTTNVFNKSTGMKTIVELKKTNEEQAQAIIQMTADEQEAKRLLIMARNEMENLEKNKAVLDMKLQQMDTNVKELVYSYEQEMQNSAMQNQQMIESMRTQLNQELEQERHKQQSEIEAQRQSLSQQLANLQAALDAAEAKSQTQEIQYVEMSNRLNKALADKVAELSKVSQYQSDFYKAIKTALGGRSSIQPDGDRFIVSSDILFNSGEYTLSLEGKNQLRLIANVIKDLENKIPTNINWIIRVDGHTDKKPVLAGTKRYKNNTQLSLLRATAVANELAKAGVSKRRLIPSGFGELYPVELGNDQASLQKNRRIELQLTNR
ncbi:MAG: OmpA family protein [Rickettsiales bacterium]|jgi:chemotaxis protein MotB|nr:OmpA family protein [Rickettsiales bacterium]